MKLPVVGVEMRHGTPVLRRGTGAYGLALLALLMPAAPTARAADPASTESCPTRAATVSAVNALLGQVPIAPEDLATVDVTDLGNRFAITVKGRTREYVELSRNCEQRARTAAVFIALTLVPPDIADANEPEPRAPSPDALAPSVSPAASAQRPVVPQRTAPPSTARAATVARWSAELDLAAKAAYDPAHSFVVWGALARGVLRRARWGIGLDWDLPAARTFALEGLRIRQSKDTAGLAIERNWVLGAIRASTEVGPTLTWLQLRQPTSPDAQRVTRWLAGLRAGVYLTLCDQRVSPFIGADLHLLPYRIPIVVEPEGTIGHMSMVWVGATLGIALATD